MSQPCPAHEFERKLQSHVAAFEMADPWFRAEALKTFLDALARLHYFRVTRAEVTPRNHPMIEVRGQFSLAKRLPDLVQIDLGTVWNEAMESAEKTLHAFTRTPDGFDGDFLFVKGAVMITIRLHVAGTH